MLIARARPATPIAGLTARLDGVFRQDVARRAESISNPDQRRVFQQQSLELEPGGRGLAGLRRQVGQPLLVLMAGVAMVLLIACANVANLMLVHAGTRRKEMAVRLSVGADRARLVRQLLTESVLIALAGGALGLWVAQWGASALLSLQTGGRADGGLELAPDLRVLAFTAGVSLLTGIAFGLAPAFQSTRVDLAGALKSGGRALHGAGGFGRRGSLGRALVVAQVAVSLLLLVAAGLFVHTLRNLSRVDPGFERDEVLNVRIDPRGAGYDEPRLVALYERLTERLAAAPGVRSASVSLCGLASGCSRTTSFDVEGYVPAPGEDMDVQINLVSPAYFETIGVPLLRGRAPDARDRKGAPLVAVVNQTMARAFYGDADPIGRRFGSDEDGRYEIVGVVRDARVNDLREAIPRMAFLPIAQNVDYVRNLDVRTVGPAAERAADVRAALRDAEPALPIGRVSTVAAQLEETLARERLVAQVTGLFSLLALGLACLGLYGVMAHTVAHRTSELGLRIALGAARAQVLGSVLIDALKLVAGGVVIGLPLAVAGGHAVASLLFGLSPTDPRTLATVTLLLVGVAAGAAYLPARRASRVDPMVALRCD
jgi:predicted permease